MHAAHSPRPGAGPRGLPFGHSCAAPSASDWQAVADGMVAAVSACAVAAAPPAANPNSSKPKLRNSTGGRRRCTTDNLNAAELGATGAEAHCVRRVRAASGRRPARSGGQGGAGCGQAARARSLRGPKNHGGATEGAAACAGRSPRTPRLASATRTCMGVGSGGVDAMCLPVRDARRASTGHAREARCAVDRGG